MFVIYPFKYEGEKTELNIGKYLTFIGTALNLNKQIACIEN